MKSLQRRYTTNVTLGIDFGEYLRGYSFLVTIGNSCMSISVHYPTKPTNRQLRKLKKAWHSEMRVYNHVDLYRKTYDIRKGKFLVRL